MRPLLRISKLEVEIRGADASGNAVDGVSIDVEAAQTVAVVGESGCGKSLTALSILGLLPETGVRIRSGTIEFDGQDLAKADFEQMRKIRGRQIGIVFQDPLHSLNPVMTIGDQIVEALRSHSSISRRDAVDKAGGLLELVSLPSARRRLRDFPHQLSGGQRQRVMIAMALAGNPRLLIADEPTTALDVTVQAQILELLKDLQGRLQMAVLLITHNLGVVAQMADRVVVMYSGKVVEEGVASVVLRDPRHPYTRGLMGATPQLPTDDAAPRSRLSEIPGLVPSIFARPAGCAFEPRCPIATEECRIAVPRLTQAGGGQRVACFNADMGGSHE